MHVRESLGRDHVLVFVTIAQYALWHSNNNNSNIPFNIKYKDKLTSPRSLG